MKQTERQYRRFAHVLYRLYAMGLAALSHFKPLFRFALRVLTRQKQPLAGRVLPAYVPLGSPENHAVSREALERLIRQSAAVCAMHECMCRRIGGCTEFPSSLGCLVLGEAAAQVHPGLGRPVRAEEALAIADTAMRLGLTPMVIRLNSDGVLWSLDRQKMLTVCFCCPCHCLIYKAAGARKQSERLIAGLPGASIAVDREKCMGCGACLSACAWGALTIVDSKAAVDEAKCLSCGRCAMACQNRALLMEWKKEGEIGI